MNTASQPLVSIVTPIHNEAKYLAECVESVLAQTYQNWDYTIVDNCSTDESLEIARSYAAKDRRIRIYENTRFLPALANFNVALRQISPSSKYCKVVLGDDWIFPECLERMVAAAEEYPSIGIVSAYALEESRLKWMGLPYPTTLITGREICRKHFLENVFVFGSPTTVLYRSDLVRRKDPFYNEANIHADTEVCFVVLQTSDFAFVHQVLTFERVRPGSRFSIASDNNTHAAGMLYSLVKHGPHYLERKELESRINDHLSYYYNFLGKSLLLGRDRSFWEYHKRQFSQAGVGFSHLRIARGVLATLSEAILNPKSSVEKLLKRLGDADSADRSQVGQARLEDAMETRTHFTQAPNSSPIPPRVKAT